MKINKYRLQFFISLLICFAVIFACGKKESTTETETTKETTKETTNETTKEETVKTGGGKLYFCEDYIDGEEINVSKRFTPGWLTVMVKTDEPLGVGKVELRLSQIKDADGNTISEKIIGDVPFDVQPNWDYTYFQDKQNLKFSKPGTYRVTLLKPDGSPIVSGEVEVVPR